jgi:hypothetical protein
VGGKFYNTFLRMVTVREHKYLMGCFLITGESHFTFSNYSVLFSVSGKHSLHACDVMSSISSPHQRSNYVSVGMGK